MSRMRLIRLIQIHNRADGHFHYFRDGSASVLLLPLSVCATLGLDNRFIKKVRKIIGVNIGAENHIPATAAVAPIRAAARDEFFASKTDATAPAVTGLGKTFYAIDKHAFLRAAVEQTAIVWPACHPGVPRGG